MYLICLTKFVDFGVSSGAGEYALALTWALSAVNFINVSINTSCSIARCLTSVQRIRELTHNKEFERDWNDPKAPENWPSEGKITGTKVSIRYRKDMPLVLDNLDYVIEGSQKVGVIGRTGSGKSTMV